MPICSPTPDDLDDLLVGEQEFLNELNGVKTGIHQLHKTVRLLWSASVPQKSASLDLQLSSNPDIQLINPPFGSKLEHASATPSLAPAASQQAPASKGKEKKKSAGMCIHILL
jgi:hypothetical protein